jgi:hypothetical protein
MRMGANSPSEPSGADAFFSACGSAMVRVALLFSTAGVALALFLAPMMQRDMRPVGQFATLDTMSTGSIGQTGSYTIRKSVLSQKPGAVCVIRSDGRRLGDC